MPQTTFSLSHATYCDTIGYICIVIYSLFVLQL